MKAVLEKCAELRQFVEVRCCLTALITSPVGSRWPNLPADAAVAFVLLGALAWAYQSSHRSSVLSDCRQLRTWSRDIWAGQELCRAVPLLFGHDPLFAQATEVCLESKRTDWILPPFSNPKTQCLQDCGWCGVPGSCHDEEGTVERGAVLAFNLFWNPGEGYGDW